eukprot:19210-Pleurochrysis_carterae.AAC.1
MKTTKEPSIALDTPGCTGPRHVAIAPDRTRRRVGLRTRCAVSQASTRSFSSWTSSRSLSAAGRPRNTLCAPRPDVAHTHTHEG